MEIRVERGISKNRKNPADNVICQFLTAGKPGSLNSDQTDKAGAVSGLVDHKAVDTSGTSDDLQVFPLRNLEGIGTYGGEASDDCREGKPGKELSKTFFQEGKTIRRG